MLKSLLIFLTACLSIQANSQKIHFNHEVIEVGETLKDYIKNNHIDEIEDIVHRFTASRLFIDYLLEQGHKIDSDSIQLRRKDVSVGEDIDIYVKHFTEHQNFTMLLVPVDIYPLAIYDTLLFSVLEVSDEWLREKFYYEDLRDDAVKSELLAKENHELLTEHMFEQILADKRQLSAELEVKLHESYITTSSIYLHTTELQREERKKMMESWSLMKKIFTHNLELNVEMNIYIFGVDDLRIVQYLGDNQKEEYRITPGNIFTRHHFLEE